MRVELEINLCLKLESYGQPTFFYLSLCIVAAYFTSKSKLHI